MPIDFRNISTTGNRRYFPDKIKQISYIPLNSKTQTMYGELRKWLIILSAQRLYFSLPKNSRYEVYSGFSCSCINSSGILPPRT